MLLTAGDRLGPYEIVGQIGAGGMGVVYRARDGRVGRDVAIKVSAEEFGERFEREARAVAALNHPNICTLHDVGPNYLVMELIEGEALKGPLPLATAFRYARQIAEALDAAHEKGIVHRDLKPANIRIRHDGTVKVLDFGLAKVILPARDEPANRNLNDSPTMAMAATEPGMILGTAPYMAPEQARGKPVDKRADIWAFGVVLYEMVTGRRAFHGEDVSSVLAAVIQSEPRWDGVPARARRVIESCLEKDPARRLRDIGDVWRLLDETPAASSRSWAGSAGWVAAVVASLAAVALWAPWRDRQVATPSPTVRLDVDLGAEVALSPLLIPTFSSIAISPDGTRLVYAGSVAGGRPRLLTRRLDQSQGTELSGTEGATNPFFSPDGQWVAFWTGHQIAKISVDGGPVVPLADVPGMTGGTWSDEGGPVVGWVSQVGTGLVRVSPTGGGSRPILDKAPGERFHSTPNVLPGGKSALIAVVGPSPSRETVLIDAVSFADGVRKTVARGAMSPRYLSSGHLIYTDRATMFAVPFDLDRLETRGTPVAVLADVAYDPIANAGQFDVSRTGTLVYRKHIPTASSTSTVEWIDPAGKHEPLLKPGSYLWIPRVSPDGRHLGLAVRDGGRQDISVYNFARGDATPVSTGVESFGGPEWSPDSKYVVFGSFTGIYWARADGSGPPQLLTSSKGIQVPTSFSPDGKHLAFLQIDGLPQVWTVPVEETSTGLRAGTPEQFLTTKFTDSDAAFSPDGKWIAYTSTESGRSEVYVRAFPAESPTGGRRWRISTSEATSPAWSSNGRDLLYRSGDRIMAVDYTASGDSFAPEKPRAWGESLGAAGAFDLAPDGRRVLALVPTATREAPQPEHSVVFILNFFDELRRRVPVSR